jgi:hypothetical protein
LLFDKSELQQAFCGVSLDAHKAEIATLQSIIIGFVSFTSMAR